MLNAGDIESWAKMYEKWSPQFCMQLGLDYYKFMAELQLDLYKEMLGILQRRL